MRALFVLWLSSLATRVTPSCTSGEDGARCLTQSDTCLEHFAGEGVQHDILSAGEHNIFFAHTTRETVLGDVQTCAVISAARKNQDRRVNLLSSALTCSGSLESAVKELPNLHVVRVDYRDVFSPYPELLAWYDSRIWDNQFRGAAISNAVRLAATHTYGGAYLDTDFLSIRPLPVGVNFIGTEDPHILNSAAMQWRRGHPFLLHAMHRFASEYIPDRWGWNGPRCILRSYKSYRTVHNGDEDIMLAPIHQLYPLSWRDFARLAEPYSMASAQLFLRDVLEGATLVHTWDHLSSKLLADTANSTEELTIHRLLATACPIDVHAPAPVFEASLLSMLLPNDPMADSRGLGARNGAVMVSDKRVVAAASLAQLRPLFLLSGGQRLIGQGAATGEASTLGGFCAQGVAWQAKPFYTPYVYGGVSSTTLSFWLSTTVATWTARGAAHDMPASYDPLSPPSRQLDISAVQAWVPDVEGAESIIIGLEHGYITLGSAARERMRSESTVHDGRWHHVVVVVSPGSLELYLNGLLHAAADDMDFSPAFRLAYLIGDMKKGSRLPPLYLDLVALYDKALGPAQIIQLRNMQQRLVSVAACRPAWPLWVADAQLAERRSDDEALVVVIGDASDEDAVFRTAARQTWMRLLQPGPLRVVFAVWEGHREATRYEQASFHDMIYVHKVLSSASTGGLWGPELFRALAALAPVGAPGVGALPPVIFIHQRVLPDASLLVQLALPDNQEADDVPKWPVGLWRGSIALPRPLQSFCINNCSRHKAVVQASDTLTISAALFSMSGDLVQSMSAREVNFGERGVGDTRAWLQEALHERDAVLSHDGRLEVGPACGDAGHVMLRSPSAVIGFFDASSVERECGTTLEDADVFSATACVGSLQGRACVATPAGYRPAGHVPLTAVLNGSSVEPTTVRQLLAATALYRKSTLAVSGGGGMTGTTRCDSNLCSSSILFLPSKWTARGLLCWLQKFTRLGTSCAQSGAADIHYLLLSLDVVVDVSAAFECTRHGGDVASYCGLVLSVGVSESSAVQLPVRIDPSRRLHYSLLRLPSASVVNATVDLIRLCEHKRCASGSIVVANVTVSILTGKEDTQRGLYIATAQTREGAEDRADVEAEGSLRLLAQLVRQRAGLTAIPLSEDGGGSFTFVASVMLLWASVMLCVLALVRSMQEDASLRVMLRACTREAAHRIRQSTWRRRDKERSLHNV